MSAPEASAPSGGQPGTARRLWVTWQNPETRHMYPVGCLALLPSGSWSFWYVRKALTVPGFRPFLHFPRLDQRYQSIEIFPMFSNRVMSPRRPDYGEYLSSLDLRTNATPFDILARSSGKRATDTIRVYPEPSVDAVSGITNCVFLAHGVRHVAGAVERIARLRAGDRLMLTREPGNPVNPRALLLDVRHEEPVGYVPDLLLDYTHTLLEYRGVEVRVQQATPSAPPTLQLLCWMAGPWPPGRTPFSGSDFEPIPG